MRAAGQARHCHRLVSRCHCRPPRSKASASWTRVNLREMRFSARESPLHLPDESGCAVGVDPRILSTVPCKEREATAPSWSDCKGSCSVRCASGPRRAKRRKCSSLKASTTAEPGRGCSSAPMPHMSTKWRHVDAAPFLGHSPSLMEMWNDARCVARRNIGRGAKKILHFCGC
jgi:hypothetical protein